ncbi:MAG: hypothetical protein FWG32_08420 [Oscillospiraceae bacterium]|nr:hypothetical protein [Oscillospiraceae bacterium]
MAAGKTAVKNKNEEADAVNASAGEGKPERGKKRGGKTKTGNKKRKSRFPLIAILIVIVLVVGFAGAVFYFDFFNVRTDFYEFLHSVDPDYKGVTDRETALAALAVNLTDREEQVLADEERLSSKDTALNEREAIIAAREKELGRWPIYRPPVNADDVSYVQNIGVIYAEMEPAAAAEIMIRLYSTEDMAAIIYYMEPPNAAAIMECMPPDEAAMISNSLLRVRE